MRSSTTAKSFCNLSVIVILSWIDIESSSKTVLVVESKSSTVTASSSGLNVVARMMSSTVTESSIGIPLNNVRVILSSTPTKSSLTCIVRVLLILSSIETKSSGANMLVTVRKSSTVTLSDVL